MKYLNLSEYGRLHKVSKQRVLTWIQQGRLKHISPKQGIYLIDDRTPRPEKMKPGVKK